MEFRESVSAPVCDISIMDTCPLLELPDELLDMVIAALARLRREDPLAMFRAARSSRRIHRAALAWICYVPGSIPDDGKVCSRIKSLHAGMGLEKKHGSVDKKMSPFWLETMNKILGLDTDADVPWDKQLDIIEAVLGSYDDEDCALVESP